MNAHPVTAAKRRSGFTLIEILVVIAIIAILASLLLGAVMMIWNKGPEVTNKNDILQLSTALQKFKSNYGQYPPDMIKLCSNSNLYGNTVLDQQSVSFLSNVMFKHLGAYAGMNWGNRSGPTAPVFGNAANPTIDILEGDQCLVFFLFGPPGLNGFSNNPQNPTMAGGDRLKFFDFNAGRLQPVQSVPPSSTRTQVLPVVAPPPMPQFPSYIDAYGKMPFIYFSAGKSTGGYVATNSLGVAPYRSGASFLNPDSFQIISAGLNMQFGAGGTWVPANTPLPGKDDVSNFHDKILGAP